MRTFCLFFRFPLSIIACQAVKPTSGIESPHPRSGPDHDPGNVITQDNRQAIRQNLLEFPVSDLGIQKVYAGGVDLDQYVILPHFRVWHFGGPHVVAASIALYDECLHHFISPSLLLIRTIGSARSGRANLRSLSA